MERIASFCVDHTRLNAGLYVSRRDRCGDCTVTTFDLRITAPNREAVMSTGCMHTLEHIVATYLRNSARKDDVVYFGPMGCRTGCYLVMFGQLESGDVIDLVRGAFAYVTAFEGEIPGAKPEECGNYSDQDLDAAKFYAAKYLKSLETPITEYPKMLV